MEMCYDGALVMPSSYAVMDEEEMTYVEGGTRVSNKQCWQIVAGLSLCPTALVAGAYGVMAIKSVVKKLSKAVSVCANVIGLLLGLALDFAISQLCMLATAIGYGCINKKGVNITFNYNIFKGLPGVNFEVL